MTWCFLIPEVSSKLKVTVHFKISYLMGDWTSKVFLAASVKITLQFTDKHLSKKERRYDGRISE